MIHTDVNKKDVQEAFDILTTSEQIEFLKENLMLLDTSYIIRYLEELGYKIE